MKAYYCATAVLTCASAAMAPHAWGATSGTVRMDFGELIDQSIDYSTFGSEVLTVDGVAVQNATGFISYDISNNTILDAELTFSDGPTLLRSFDETEFLIDTTAGGVVTFGLNTPAPKLNFGNYLMRSSSSTRIDFANETGNVRFFASPLPGNSSAPNTLFNSSPALTFTPVPEPTSLALLGVGVVGLMARRRRGLAG